MSAPVARARIMEIHPYVAGQSKVGDKAPFAKLSSNESPLGPSPRAIEAFNGASSVLERYPEGGSTELRRALGELHNINAERIVCTDGSSQALDILARSYVNPGDDVVFPEYGFLVYRLSTLSASGNPILAPEKNFTTDVDALLAAVTDKTRIVFLANPNNPTGSLLPDSEVERLRAGLREDVLLVIDAAYAEYVERDDYGSYFDMVDSGADNVVVTRTFSKIYGLAALRAGWVYCPEPVAAVLNRVRDPFNLSVPAQMAALAALGDTDHLAAARDNNSRWLPWLSGELEKLGLTVTPSFGNFILIHFPDGPGQSAAADEYLKANGIIIRPLQPYNLSQCLRATIGLEDENRALADGLKAFLAG